MRVVREAGLKPVPKLVGESPPSANDTEVNGQEPGSGVEVDVDSEVWLAYSSIQKAPPSAEQPLDLNIPPNATGSKRVKVPSVTGMKIKDAMRVVREAGLRPVPKLVGESPPSANDTEVNGQEPSSGVVVDAGSDVWLAYSSTKKAPPPTAAGASQPGPGGTGGPGGPGGSSVPGGPGGPGILPGANAHFLHGDSALIDPQFLATEIVAAAPPPPPPPPPPRPPAFLWDGCSTACSGSGPFSVAIMQAC